jgi:hypothetical protein
MTDLVRPSFKPASMIGHRTLVKIVESTFAVERKTREHVPTATELCAPRLRIKTPQGVFRTFNTENWTKKKPSEITVGYKGPLYVPDDSSSSQKAVVGVVTAIEDPQAFEWLRTMIGMNRLPVICHQMHVAFEVTCSYATSLQLSGAVIDWPSTDGFASTGLDGMQQLSTPPATNMFAATDEQAEIYYQAVRSIQEIVAKVGEHLPTEMVQALLPVGTMIRTFVSKTIAEWRLWFGTVSETAECSWLAGQLWKYLDDALPVVFEDVNPQSEE